ncbi:DNA breaking-rejoining protein [Tamlana sp. I1]|uniref:DNA breaking-rejoining protein n=1 Tax=Tamlana sp. I1 TaxID=2762061 RepID=UPI00188FD042|nr:DNA breaking-rejoining protein [Tamlana sp. I1]
MKNFNPLNSNSTFKAPLLKKLSFSILAVLFAFSSLHAQSASIKTEQVHFEKGTTGTFIESSIKGEHIVDYKINVRKGQFMNVSMVTDNTANYFNIMEPGEEYVAIYNSSMDENMFEGELAKSGDYTIRVYLMRSAARRNEKANFKLEVNVSSED